MVAAACNATEPVPPPAHQRLVAVDGYLPLTMASRSRRATAMVSEARRCQR